MRVLDRLSDFLQQSPSSIPHRYNSFFLVGASYGTSDPVCTFPFGRFFLIVSNYLLFPTIYSGKTNKVEKQKKDKRQKTKNKQNNMLTV